LAVGYYDRRKPAMREALSGGAITREALEAIGTRHQVCPFQLAQDVSLWAEVVICDYNYVFDPKVYLETHFAEEGGKFGFLVDEAHNLVDRAREMFSEELDEDVLQTMSQAVKPTIPKCARALKALREAIRQLAGNAEDVLTENNPDELDLFAAKSAPTPNEPKMAATGVLRDFPEALSPYWNGRWRKWRSGWRGTRRRIFVRSCLTFISGYTRSSARRICMTSIL
jgi:hypothetical protein